MKRIALVFLVLLSCDKDDVRPADGGVVDGGNGDAPAAKAVWPSDATKLVAVARGGFLPAPPAGSDCMIVDATYTLDVAARTLEWRYCHPGSPGAPYRWETGTGKLLPDADFDQLVAALKAVAVSTKKVCGLDKAELTITVASATGETRYIDSFYSCEPVNAGRTPVDNLDQVFLLLQAQTPSAPTAP